MEGIVMCLIRYWMYRSRDETRPEKTRKGEQRGDEMEKRGAIPNEQWWTERAEASAGGQFFTHWLWPAYLG